MPDTPLPKRINADASYRERQRRYDENRRYYNGDHPISRRLRQSQRAPRNYTALFVDTIVAHMGSARVTFGPDPAADALDDYVARVLARNDGEQLDYDAEVACAVDGDAAIKVTWDAEEQRVRVTLVDPKGIWAATRPDDPREIAIVAQQYTLTAEDFPLVFPNGRVEMWGNRRRALITEAWTNTYWQVWVGEDLMFTEPNPYGLIPYVIYPNWRAPGELWGTGDPERIRPLQDALNNGYADLDWLMELASNVIVLEGVDGGDLAVRPGAIWELPQDAHAYVLELLQGDVTGQRLAYLRDILHAMHAISRVPETALGSTDREVSGFALQIELGPLIRLVARKRLSRSAALRRRAQLIAALGAKFDGQPVATTVPEVIWTDAIPTDRSDELANAQVELALGRDPAAVLRSIGVENPDAELAASLRHKRALAAMPAQPQQGGADERPDQRADE